MEERVARLLPIWHFENKMEDEVVYLDVGLFMIEGLDLKDYRLLRSWNLHLFPNLVLPLQLNPNPQSDSSIPHP